MAKYTVSLLVTWRYCSWPSNSQSITISQTDSQPDRCKSTILPVTPISCRFYALKALQLQPVPHARIIVAWHLFPSSPNGDRNNLEFLELEIPNIASCFLVKNFYPRYMGSFFGIVNQTVNSDIKQWKKTEKSTLTHCMLIHCMSEMNFKITSHMHWCCSKSNQQHHAFTTLHQNKA